MKRLILLALCFILIACSNNPFYSPNKYIKFNIDDFSHPVENKHILSTSGNKLHLQLHYQTKYSTPKGLITHFHGNSGNLSQTIEKVAWLANQGFDLIVFDYSGFGQSTGKANRDNLQKDAITLLRYTSNLKEYPQKILIGTSMGGAIVSAALPASNLEKQFDALILDSTFDTYGNLGRDVVAEMPLGSIISLFAKLFISDDLSPAHEIKKLEFIPVIVFHCIQDSLIPIERSLLLYQEIATPKAYWPMTDCAHARTFTNKFPQYQSTLLSIIDSFNPESDNLEQFSRIKLNNMPFQ